MDFENRGSVATYKNSDEQEYISYCITCNSKYTVAENQRLTKNQETGK